VWTKKRPPLSRVSSKGGVGWSGCVDRVPLRLVIRAREGTEGVQRHDKERCLSLRRVGSVVACSQ